MTPYFLSFNGCRDSNPTTRMIVEKMDIESVNNLDEAMVLGYFASLKSSFLLKLILLSHFLVPDSLSLDPKKIDRSIASEVSKRFHDPNFFKALVKGNKELTQNFLDDAVTSLIMSSWTVCEQVLKDLAKPDYTRDGDDVNLCYDNSRFAFSKQEKKNIGLFYYIRNAICHHNGAYYASTAMNHTYQGKSFRSEGNLGNKIEIDLLLAWSIASDLEGYTEKAWSNSKKDPPS
jgi:hypothetical protein